MSNIIVYGYRESPFYQKLLLVLLFKQLPYSIVKTSRVLPRPELEALGISYRRIPVLAIGNDVYCDTSLAFLALDKLPGGGLDQSHYGLVNAASFFWSDRAIFRIAASFMPIENWTPAFVKDRSSFAGAPINPAKIEAARPLLLSTLRSHLSMIETQLATRSSSSNYILDTKIPTYLDLSLFFTLNWIERFKTADSIFAESDSTSPFPRTLAWIAQLRSDIGKLTGTTPVAPFILSDSAAAIIHSAPRSALMSDVKEPLLASNGGFFSLGKAVQVTPDDSGRVPQKGKLVALNTERSVLEVANAEGKLVRVHFPRLGFGIGKERAAKI